MMAQEGLAQGPVTDLPPPAAMPEAPPPAAVSDEMQMPGSLASMGAGLGMPPSAGRCWSEES